jgi:hypothetical protein
MFKRPPHEADVAQQQAVEFVERQANDILIQLGYQGEPSVRFGTQWAWSPDTHETIVDITAFGDETYKPEWRTLAFTHEIEAHHAPARKEPLSAEQDNTWGEEHPAAHFFTNVMADIAGNRSIISKVPDANAGWRDFYANKLFEPTDYSREGTPKGNRPIPRHIQFLYAMLRESFVPDETCTVDPEVRQALDSLHDFRGSGQDLIDYSTQPYKTPSTYLSRTEQMKLWRKGIWPTYLELYDQDKDDPEYQQQDSDQQSSGDQSPNQKQDRSDNSGNDGGNNESDKQDWEQFAEDYEDYEENHHPGGSAKNDPDGQQAEAKQAVINEILGRETDGQESEAGHEQASPQAPQPAEQQPSLRATEAERARSQQAAMAKTAGVSLEDYRAYQRQLDGALPIVQDMRRVFEQFINERITHKTTLQHRSTEGAVLDPDHLSQTYAQLKDPAINNDEIPAFLEYGTSEAEREISGKIDWWLVSDISGTMQSYGRSGAAAKAALVLMEGLDMFNEMVREESAARGMELDYDARTAVVAFGSNSQVLKPLSNSLTTKERVEVTQTIRAAEGGRTMGSLGLEPIVQEYQARPAADRKKVVTFLTDGLDYNPSELVKRIKYLRGQGVLVYPIYIGTPVVDPAGIRLDDVSQLPDILAGQVERSLR